MVMASGSRVFEFMLELMDAVLGRLRVLRGAPWIAWQNQDALMALLDAQIVLKEQGLREGCTGAVSVIKCGTMMDRPLAGRVVLRGKLTRLIP